MPAAGWSQKGPTSSQSHSLSCRPSAFFLSFVVISCVVWRGRCGPLHAFFRTRRIGLPCRREFPTLAPLTPHPDSYEPGPRVQRPHEDRHSGGDKEEVEDQMVCHRRYHP